MIVGSSRFVVIGHYWRRFLDEVHPKVFEKHPSLSAEKGIGNIKNSKMVPSKLNLPLVTLVLLESGSQGKASCHLEMQLCCTNFAMCFAVFAMCLFAWLKGPCFAFDFEAPSAAPRSSRVTEYDRNNNIRMYISIYTFGAFACLSLFVPCLSLLGAVAFLLRVYSFAFT